MGQTDDSSTRDEFWGQVGQVGGVGDTAAGLLALVAPSSGDAPNQCTPLLQQMKAGKAPAAVKKQK